MALLSAVQYEQMLRQYIKTKKRVDGKFPKAAHSILVNLTSDNKDRREYARQEADSFFSITSVAQFCDAHHIAR